MLDMLEVLGNVTCGSGDSKIVIDSIVPSTISFVVDLIKIGVPILLIIFGMLDLGKAVMSNDEKEMKAGQSKLIKRCLYAVLVFFIVAIVQFLVGVLNNNGEDVNGKNIESCISCFINGECNE